MNDQINKPHDNVIKNILGRESNAKDFVRYYLPQEITKDLDLETLEVSSQSYPIFQGSFLKYSVISICKPLVA